MAKMSTRKRGFTLIELLVVIAIIGVLAALIAGVALHATASATRTSCLNGLRQIGAGLNIYVQKNDYHLPSCTMRPSAPPADEVGLPGIAETLLDSCGGDRQLFRCPADPDQKYFKLEGSSYEWQSSLLINGKLLDPKKLKLLGYDRFVLMDYDNFHEEGGGSAKNYLYPSGHVTDKVE